jgi:hypothetical protein
MLLPAQLRLMSRLRPARTNFLPLYALISIAAGLRPRLHLDAPRMPFISRGHVLGWCLNAAAARPASASRGHDRRNILRLPESEARPKVPARRDYGEITDDGTTLDPPDYDAATERMRQIVARRLKGAPAKSDRYSIHMAQEARVEIGTIPQNA